MLVPLYTKRKETATTDTNTNLCFIFRSIKNHLMYIGVVFLTCVNYFVLFALDFFDRSYYLIHGPATQLDAR